MSYPISHHFPVMDVTSFLIIIVCKVTQYICCNLIILFTFMAAAGRNK